MNKVTFNTEARNKLLAGINIVAEAVGSTLGPRGRNVAVDQFPGIDVPPTVLHDGVSVAQSIKLEDPLEDMGVRLLKAAALKTNEVAGDGTTTATVLAQAIITEALKIVEAGNNPMVLKKEIEEASYIALADLSKMAKEIKNDAEIEQIATISSADPVIGKLVADAIKTVGVDGVTTVEEGDTVNTTVEHKQGMEFDRGYISPYFVSNKERMEAEVDEPYILVSDFKINYNHNLMPFLENFVKETGSKNLVIIASEVLDEALKTLCANKLQDRLNIMAVNAPAFGTARADYLEDIAVLTGAKLFLTEAGIPLEDITAKDLGRAERITATETRTVILNGEGNKDRIEGRIEDIKEQLKLNLTGFEKDIRKERLAKLAGGIAIIKVGATTEIELKEKKERVIDAVNSTKAAIEGGVVAGGEVTLLKLATKAPVETVGGRILAEALKSPFKKLLDNSGLDYAEVLQKFSKGEINYGIDVIDGKYKDLIKAGIIDPVKVTRSALENAVSVAVMVITTACLVTEVTK